MPRLDACQVPGVKCHGDGELLRHSKRTTPHECLVVLDWGRVSTVSAGGAGQCNNGAGVFLVGREAIHSQNKLKKRVSVAKRKKM